MKKNLIPSLLSLGSLLIYLTASQSLAEINLNKYHWGPFDLNGTKAKNANGSAVNIDNTKKIVEGKISQNNSYRMTWGNEDMNHTPVFTMTEARMTPTGKEVTVLYSRTSTFNPKSLRSTTMCFGDSQKHSGVARTDMKCVTATKQSCQRLMESYGQQFGKDGLQKDSQVQLAQTAQACSGVLRNYEAMAKAFGNHPAQDESNHKEVIRSDTARVKSFVDETTGSRSWEPTNIGSASTSEELDKMAKSFADSIEGMQAITMAIQVCADATPDFQDVAAPSTGTGTTSNGNATAQ